MTSATTMLQEIPGGTPPSLNSWPAIIGVAIGAILWGGAKLRTMWGSEGGQADVIGTLREQLDKETARADKNAAARDAAVDQIGAMRMQIQDLTLQVQALQAQVKAMAK